MGSSEKAKAVGGSGDEAPKNAAAEASSSNTNDTQDVLPKEIKVDILQKYQEMKPTEEISYNTEVEYEWKTVIERRTKIEMKEQWTTFKKPEVKLVDQTKRVKTYREITVPTVVTEMVPKVELVAVVTEEDVSKVITYYQQQTVCVPVTKEVTLFRDVVVPTGEYITVAEEYMSQAGHSNLLGRHQESNRTGAPIAA